MSEDRLPVPETRVLAVASHVGSVRANLDCAVVFLLIRVCEKKGRLWVS